MERASSGESFMSSKLVSARYSCGRSDGASANGVEVLIAKWSSRATPQSHALRQDLARVEDSVRVERDFELTHQTDFSRAAGVPQPLFLEQPDAVLGADAAVVRTHQREEIGVDLVGAREERVLRERVGLHDVHVQVSVADVAEQAELERGVALLEQHRELGAEGLQGADRQGDVILVGQAGGREALADALAVRPQRARLLG